MRTYIISASRPILSYFRRCNVKGRGRMFHRIRTPHSPDDNIHRPRCIRDPSEWDTLLIHLSSGGIARNEIERPALGFVEQTAHIFAKDAQEEELQSAKHQHDGHQGRIASHRIAE